MASDEDAVDYKAEAESHREDSSIPVAAMQGVGVEAVEGTRTSKSTREHRQAVELGLLPTHVELCNSPTIDSQRDYVTIFKQCPRFGCHGVSSVPNCFREFMPAASISL